jgi:hypothetical protein
MFIEETFLHIHQLLAFYSILKCFSFFFFSLLCPAAVHSQKLQLLCRVCGKKAEEKAISKSTLASDLKAVFNIDIIQDTDDVHPTKVCSSHASYIYRFRQKKSQKKKKESHQHQLLTSQLNSVRTVTSTVGSVTRKKGTQKKVHT